MSIYSEIHPTSIELCAELFAKFIKEGNLEGVVGLYEPDAVFVSREGEVTSGSDAIRELYQGLLSIKAEFQLDPIATIYADDIALDISDWQLTGTAPDGSPVSDNGRSYDIYRCQADGTWRIVIDNPHGYSTTERKVQTAKADTETETSVLAVLKEFAQSYARLNQSNLLALHAPDADAVVFDMGTRYLGPDEIRALLEHDVATCDAVSITYGWTSVRASGSVAWVAADATFRVTRGGQERTVAGWLTFVLEKRGDTWLIVQAHLSPVATGRARS